MIALVLALCAVASAQFVRSVLSEPSEISRVDIDIESRDRKLDSDDREEKDDNEEQDDEEEQDDKVDDDDAGCHERLAHARYLTRRQLGDPSPARWLPTRPGTQVFRPPIA